jgi:hypothetical protein
MKSVYSYAKSVMLDPRRFFTQVQKEKNSRRVLNFLTVFALSVFVILTFHYLRVFNSFTVTFNQMLGFKLFSQIPLTLSTYALLYVVSVVVFMGLSILRYRVTHLFVRMLGGKKDYNQTYKALVYTLTPEYLSMPILVAIGVLIPIAYLKAQVSLWILIGLLVIVFSALGFYQVYLRVIGLSKLQSITYMRSFLAIYVLGMLTQMLIVLIIEVALIATVLFLYLSL